MSNEHTPGPWVWIDNPSGPWPTLIGPAGDSWIAMSSDPNSANARLIAAAPGLLAALKRTLSMAIGHAADARGVSPAECRDFPWAVDAQAAIDNATAKEEA